MAKTVPEYLAIFGNRKWFAPLPRAAKSAHEFCAVAVYAGLRNTGTLVGHLGGIGVVGMHIDPVKRLTRDVRPHLRPVVVGSGQSLEPELPYVFVHLCVSAALQLRYKAGKVRVARRFAAYGFGQAH